MSIVWVLQGSGFYPSASKIDLSDLAVQAANAADDAASYARQSPYTSDIEAGSGLLFDSVVFDTPDDYKVWFRLPRSHQMVGVRMVQGRPADVYCDHP